VERVHFHPKAKAITVFTLAKIIKKVGLRADR
jgi:hypothetical protein